MSRDNDENHRISEGKCESIRIIRIAEKNIERKARAEQTFFFLSEGKKRARAPCI